MVGNGSTGKSAQPVARRRSTLDAIKHAALIAAKELYRDTGREIRGLGVAVDDTLFENAAIVFVDRTAAQAGPGTSTERLEAILAAGYFDGKIDDAGTEIPIRIAREDLIRS